VPTSHPSGWAHADGALSHSRGPSWLREPSDPNELVTSLWSEQASKADGVLSVGGVALTDLVREHGSPAYVLDEADFRARARAFRDAFSSYDVYYAGKAFLCTTVVRWLAEEGLSLDVCSGGELLVAERAGFPMARIGFHGNNKTVSEIERAVELGVGRIIVDSFDEIGRLSAVSHDLGRTTSVMIRVTAGVEAHTHEYIATAHEDQKFGFSIASGDALRAARLVHEAPRLRLLGLHSHIGSQIFDTNGFEVAARRTLKLFAQFIEPGRAIVGPAMCTVYSVGTVKQVALDGGARRTYVSVDGGMSDNIRTALYDADYSATLASRASTAPPVLSRIVGKHCEAGDIVVKDEFLPGDVGPGDLLAVPGTGAYCRSMASNYNHALRPPVIGVRDGTTFTVLRRETEDDLLASDVGVS